MKNATQYARKVKNILSGGTPRKPEKLEPDMIRLLVMAVLEEDTAGKEAASAIHRLEEEFVDFNELRVSPIKDIVDAMGRDFPGARAKAEAMTVGLNAVFDNANTLSLEYLAKKPKREVRRLLREQYRLSPYAEAVITLTGFSGHAIPVDTLLVDAMKMEDYLPADARIEEVQGFLERLTPAKDALAVHDALRNFAAKLSPKVYKEWARRKREQRLAQEAKEKAAAEARMKAEAAARAKAEAEALLKAKAAAHARAKVEAHSKAKAQAKRDASARKIKGARAASDKVQKGDKVAKKPTPKPGGKK